VDRKKQAQKLIKNKPYMVWYSKNYSGLSEKSIIESVLNYGSWEDFLKLEKIYGTSDLSHYFDQIINQKRVNLSPQVVNYFSNYFKFYA